MPKKIADIRRAEIVRALYDAIQIEGVSLPSYDHIAREGDMSRQLVRHYYRDPEQMAVDLCDDLAATYKDLLMRGVLHAEPADRLRVLLDFYFDRLADKGLGKPQDEPVYDALFALASVSERVRNKLREQFSELRHALADEMQASHPELSPAGCSELAYLVVSQMYGHWTMKATLGMANADSDTPRAAIDRLIASYVASHDERAPAPVRSSATGTPSGGSAREGTMELAAP